MNRKSGVIAIATAAVVLLFIGFIFIASIGEAQSCYQTPTNVAGQPVSQTEKDIKKSLGNQDISLFDTFLHKFSQSDQAEQRKYAALIVTIGVQRPDKPTDLDIAIALATAIQESKLKNLNYGDLDSLGLFQQRVSMKSYGTAAEIMDPSHAINVFYDQLHGVAQRDSMTMMNVAIKVQRPSRKAYESSWKWDDLAKSIVSLYKTSATNPNDTNIINMCVQNAGVSTAAGGEVHLPLDPGYHVSDGFADPRPSLSIGSKPHIGIDMVYGSDTLGKTVYAAFSGVVIQSGYGGGCNASNNNPVMILTKEGFEIGYLHMNGQQILVQKGDAVVAGQKIGSIGSCGQSTGPHLHFEVTPANDHDSWLSSVRSVIKYGSTWLDPEGVMAHYSVKLLP